jgi:cyclase
MPCLLLKDLGLVKTVQFKNPRYIGDPMNAVRIFNAKEADELVFLDICATREKRTIDVSLVGKIAGETLMPFAVGGGIRNIRAVRELITSGAEKVVINSFVSESPEFVREVADTFGSQSVVVSIDALKKADGRYEAMTRSGIRPTGLDPVVLARKAEEYGAGEILITSIDRDGSMQGYDLELVALVSRAVGLPVIACGGAGNLADFREAVLTGGATAVAAGSLFVYHGKRRAVLISFPSKAELLETFAEIA